MINMFLSFINVPMIFEIKFYTHVCEYSTARSTIFAAAPITCVRVYSIARSTLLAAVPISCVYASVCILQLVVLSSQLFASVMCIHGCAFYSSQYSPRSCSHQLCVCMCVHSIARRTLLQAAPIKTNRITGRHVQMKQRSHRHISWEICLYIRQLHRSRWYYA